METFSSPALNPSEVGPLCSHVLGLLYFMAQTPAPPPRPWSPRQHEEECLE